MSVSELIARHIDLSRVHLDEAAADDTGTAGKCLVDPLTDLLVSHGGDPVPAHDGEHRDLTEAMIAVAVMRTVRRPGLGIDSAARWALRMLGHTNSCRAMNPWSEKCKRLQPDHLLSGEARTPWFEAVLTGHLRRVGPICPPGFSFISVDSSSERWSLSVGRRLRPDMRMAWNQAGFPSSVPI